MFVRRVGDKNVSEARGDGEMPVKGMPGSVTGAILGQRVLTLSPEEQTLPTGTAHPPPPLLIGDPSSGSPALQPHPPHPRFILFHLSAVIYLNLPLSPSVSVEVHIERFPVHVCIYCLDATGPLKGHGRKNDGEKLLCELAKLFYVERKSQLFITAGVDP